MKHKPWLEPRVENSKTSLVAQFQTLTCNSKLCLKAEHRGKAWQTYMAFPVHAGCRAGAAGVIVEGGVFHQGGKDEQEADGDEKVHGRHVGHVRQRRPRHRTQRGHRQHSRDACRGSRQTFQSRVSGLCLAEPFFETLT